MSTAIAERGTHLNGTAPKAKEPHPGAKNGWVLDGVEFHYGHERPSKLGTYACVELEFETEGQTLIGAWWRPEVWIIKLGQSMRWKGPLFEDGLPGLERAQDWCLSHIRGLEAFADQTIGDPQDGSS